MSIYSNMSDDLISVIVPIYNIEQYVGLCIESIIKQTYKTLEIILVDDGSTDRSASICDLYARKDQRIKVIHKENGGLVSARKAGVAIAQGAYIGYVDGDDWIESDYYEVMHRSAVKADADIVCAGFSRDLFSQRVKCANSVLDGIYEGEGLEKLFSQMLICDNYYTIGVTTYVWNKLFRTEVVKQAQGNVDDRITIGEDAAVTYPAMLKSSRVYICDNSSYHYRQREGSMLKQYSAIGSEMEKIKYMYEYLSKVFCRDSRHDILIDQLKDFTLGYFIMRSGGVLPSVKDTAFGTSFEGKRVVVVLAGTFGQMVYNRLKQTKYCKIVGWFDYDYWEYRRCNMDVNPLTDIERADYDYAIIAKTNKDDIERIKERLIRAGVDEEKILSMDCDVLDRNWLLKEFFRAGESW